MKLRQVFAAIAGIISVAFSSQIWAAPPTPEVNVVNTPDVYVANTISIADLAGIQFGPGQFSEVFVSFSDPVNLRSISTSIAPTTAGDICDVSIGARDADAPTFTSIGLSVMSNGDAATVSQNFEIPITLQILHFDVAADGDPCVISLSVVAELIPEASPEALGAAAETERRVQIEAR